DLDVRPLDITDPDSVDACVNGVLADYGHIDALVNNAGSGHVGTLEQFSMDTFRQVVDTNLVGTVQMTKAVLQEDGTWHLDGVKRFITSGEQDITENIMHLVLARPEGPGIEPRVGTKGLSLFLVPKFHFDPKTGEPGERNGAYVTNVEHKMGLNASATCELTFGQHGRP
ncbi:SDR family NAD(P)-dependent oxidoreductase, partial [Kibdelosporangium lantanae]